jgi:hypothetical protein
MSMVLVLSSLTDRIFVGQQDVFSRGDLVAFGQSLPVDRTFIRVRSDDLDAVVGPRIDQVEIETSPPVREESPRWKRA